MPKFVQAYSSQSRVATLVKETQTGKLVKEWEAALASANSQPELVDIASSVSSMLAVKDDEELVRCFDHFRLHKQDNDYISQKIIRTAANLTSTLLTHYIAIKLETILDKEGKITHEQFAGQIEARLGSGEGDVRTSQLFSECTTLTRAPQVDWGSTEFCYSPIIQSKSTKSGYDLRSTAESSNDLIAHSGVFLIATGIRYRGYCTNVARTIIVAPTKVGRYFVLTLMGGTDMFLSGTRRNLQSAPIIAS
jgi:nucleosome binding factor SPN SPT16 subunit